MNDDQHFLANAYLDGELTVDERAIAEADPDVMSEVDRLRSLQSMLRDVRPPSAASRSAAIAAAMAEFSAVPGAPAGSNRSGNVVPMASRRPAYGRYLGVAAAVVAIGVGGLVVAGQFGGGSDDDSSADMTSLESSATFAQNTMAADESREADSASPATTAAAADVPLVAPTSADEMMTEAAPTDDGAGAPDTSEGSDTLADQTASATIAASDSLYPTSGGPIEPLADRDQTITSRGQLAGLGQLLIQLRNDGQLGATPETRCQLDPLLEIVDVARYRIDDSSGTTQDVLVALINDGIEGHTAAIDPDTCRVIAVGP